VDVIEFGGAHIQKFYPAIAERFASPLRDDAQFDRVKNKLRPDLTPRGALLLTTRLFISYFMLEVMFGVQPANGASATDRIHEIADIIRNGICARS
jgi:hypothetical protein